MTAESGERRTRWAGVLVAIAFVALLAPPAGAEPMPVKPAKQSEIYQPHTLTLTLKNFMQVTRGQLGEYKYRSVSAPVLAVHPHIVLGLAGRGVYADDGLDLAGNDYHLYLIYGQQGLATLLTLAPDLQPAPLRWLTPEQKEILRASIREVAQSGCHHTLPAAASTAELTRFDLEPCVKRLFAAR